MATRQWNVGSNSATVKDEGILFCKEDGSTDAFSEAIQMKLRRPSHKIIESEALSIARRTSDEILIDSTYEGTR